MPLISQLRLVMMSKYSKFDVDTCNTFRVMGYIKVKHNDDGNDDLATISSKQTS